MRCVVPGCNNKSYSSSAEVSYHRIPKKAWEVWRDILNLAEENKVWLRICSAHFSPEHFVKKGEFFGLKSTAVPNSFVLATTVAPDAAVENITVLTSATDPETAQNSPVKFEKLKTAKLCEIIKEPKPGPSVSNIDHTYHSKRLKVDYKTDTSTCSTSQSTHSPEKVKKSDVGTTTISKPVVQCLLLKVNRSTKSHHHKKTSSESEKVKEQKSREISSIHNYCKRPQKPITEKILFKRKLKTLSQKVRRSVASLKSVLTSLVNNKLISVTTSEHVDNIVTNLLPKSLEIGSSKNADNSI